MTVNQLVASILDGEHDADLDQIDRAIRSRKKNLFRRGTRVRGVGGRIDGQTGIVTKVNLKRISVTMDDDGRDWLVPVSMLEVI